MILAGQFDSLALGATTGFGVAPIADKQQKDYFAKSPLLCIVARIIEGNLERAADQLEGGRNPFKSLSGLAKVIAVGNNPACCNWLASGSLPPPDEPLPDEPPQAVSTSAAAIITTRPRISISPKNFHRDEFH